MPTPPRRRPAGPPTRRPKVAGLRKPARPDVPDESDAGTKPPAARDERPATGGAHPQARPDAPVSDTAITAPAPVPPADEPEPDIADGPVDERDTDLQDEQAPADPDVADSDEPVTPTVTDGVITASPAKKSDESHSIDSAEDDLPPRPSPTGKRRAGGRAAPRDLAVAERSTGGRTRSKAAIDPGKRALNGAIALAVVALLLAALGLYFKGQADRLTSGADKANTAFTDAAATAEVKTQIVAGLERALSYDYRDLDRTAAAVKEVLAGRAVCEYDAMFGQLRELAPAQKLVHTTIVRELGVRQLSADRAEALVFIDQTSTRVEEDQTTASGAQLGVTAERVDGAWKITEFDTFNQPLPNGQPLPQC
ncbi:hypothetical protein [Actinokineospora sp. UTMC 2448]|uniref:hypothetical protein n=1 Tax=Actinokineospora sp. UTMC 2448 TaxID=2268449 RepID=UPI002164DB43|nr:hypothetical protein [Actinokineospora sp. UTMC 2448]UVS82188.1 hypothetical protein Actkin_05953 [Actinokineospora sp. UTMC 2448]